MLNVSSSLLEASRIQILTPSQGEGPFYPTVLRHEWPESDSLYTDQSMLPARERLRLRVHLELSSQALRGQVFRMELWHASREGRYRHPGDPEWMRLWDPAFLGYAQQSVLGGMSVDFTTCVPGIFWDSKDGPRPRHIHLKLRDGGGNELFTTQIYFQGDRLNAFEASLGVLSLTKREELLAPLVWNSVLQSWVSEFRVRLGIRLPG
jgi:protocatechuate 3,4-dioxygenase beta subunit